MMIVGLSISLWFKVMVHCLFIFLIVSFILVKSVFIIFVLLLFILLVSNIRMLYLT
jgi:hypothetical protein